MNFSKIRKFVIQIISLASLLIGTAYAQTKFTLPQITPHGPEAASLGKYGDIPVSLNNGIANISIPLFEIKSGAFTIPISLSYHNNGLKVDEIPGCAGLGWDIRAGGVINYQQKGNPDFAFSEGLFASASLDSLKKYLNNQMNATRKFNYLENVIDGVYDSEYDQFQFNFFGYSGMFYFDSTQKIVCVPKTDLRITGSVDGFEITDEKGNRFGFGLKEHSQMGPDPNDARYPRKSFNDNSSFYLTRITTVDNRVIDFIYGKYPLVYSTESNFLNHVGGSPLTPYCPTSAYVTNETFFEQDNYILTEIVFEDGKVEFEMDTAMRKDLKKIDALSLVPSLRRIILKNEQGAIVKRFDLQQSYFGTNDRLKLNEIVQINGTDTSATWKFDYYGTGDPFPPFFSNTKDHWGYANATNAHISGIPKANYNSLVYGWTNDWRATADRRPNLDVTQRGTLKTITYPTGGKTNFEYELNQFTIQSYSQLSGYPFLDYNEQEYSQEVNIVNENTTGNPEITGSFTLTQTERIRILASESLEPLSLVESEVILSTTFGGPDIIAPQLGYSCALGSCAASGFITLNAGTYYYKLRKNIYDPTLDPDAGLASLQVWKLVFDSIIPYKVGGLRVTTIQNEDGTGKKMKKRYEYRDRLDSLVFKNIPHYMLTIQEKNYGGTSEQTIYGCFECATQYKLHAESVIPMQGNPVEYLYVTEYADSAGVNGKTDYVFSAPENLSDNGGRPYFSPLYATWRSGLTKSKKIYKKEGGAYELILKDTTAYEFTYPYNFVTKGIKVEYDVFCPIKTPDFVFHAVNVINYQTEKFYPKSTSQTVFSNGGSLINNSENSFSSAYHNQLTQTSTLNSLSQTVKEKIKYSFDYDTTTVTDASSIAIRNLQRKNIVAPIEKVMTKTIGGQEYVINATLFTYFDNKPVMNKVYQTKLSSPLLASSFSASTVNGSGNFIKDAVYEERAELVSYDSYNNLLEQEYNNNIRTSYLWDYDSLLLIAEVINAPASRIAYTSFEANGKGGWTFSGSPSADATTVTGQKCYDMSAGNITKSSLPNTTYIVSYWGKNGSVTVNGNGPATTGRTIGSWTYYEHEIAGTSVTVSGNKYIDELRLYPEGAHMKTYTHIPLVGISSQCDENNRTSYFEYDVFGRLSLVRDQDKNILKKICYNYSGQREDCVPFFNTVQNQNFTRNNCASGYVGSTVTYTVPANTYSSTISQAEANLFAQADINSNGQAYANTNGTCTLAPCNSGNCSGNDKKCIEGVCETGYWACISVVQFGRAYKCTFAYCFSDGTLSTYTVEEVHTNPCVVDGCE